MNIYEKTIIERANEYANKLDSLNFESLQLDEFDISRIEEVRKALVTIRAKIYDTFDRLTNALNRTIETMKKKEELK